MKDREIERSVFDLAQEAAAAVNARVLDVQFVKEGNDRYLRIYIEKDEGVSIDDCAEVSNAVGEQLDKADYIAGSYILQVSSPGEMPLRSVEDYRRFAGRYARFETFAAINGAKAHEGVIDSVDGQSLTLKHGDASVTLPLDKVSRARLAIPF